MPDLVSTTLAKFYYKKHRPSFPIQRFSQLSASAQVSVESYAQEKTRISILEALKAVASNSQQVADRLDDRYSEGDIYFRLNVHQGLEDVELSDWKEASTIAGHTSNYIAAQKRYISKCFESLQHVAIPGNPEERNSEVGSSSGKRCGFAHNTDWRAHVGQM